MIAIQSILVQAGRHGPLVLVAGLVAGLAFPQAASVFFPLLPAVPNAVRRVLEVWCFGVGAAVMWYFAYYCQKFVFWSWKFNDISQSQDKTALWIPQSLMLAGAVILAIALTDHFLRVLITGDHGIERDLADQSHGE